jgi:adenylate kinase family enzyme
MAETSPKKIAIIGMSGAGKTTLARRLSPETKLPAYHMDTFFWRGKWNAVPEAEYLKEHELLLQKPTWIIEGFVNAKMADRVATADLILYLDYSRLRCFWQTLRRWTQYRGKSRPELPDESRERFYNPRLWLNIVRGSERKDIEQALKSRRMARLSRFRSPKALEQFLGEQTWNN